MAFPGTLDRLPFESVVSVENLGAHPLTSVFRAKSVRGLVRVAEASGFRPTLHYASKCYLCQEAQSWLAPQHPDVLACIRSTRSPEPNQPLHGTPVMYR
jgi:hypothetical protein